MHTYKRMVQYHETDKMGITHHSNYVKYMEEARTDFLCAVGLSYAKMEEMGIVSPVTEISLNYKKSSTYGDYLDILVEIKRYNGIRLEVEYVMTNDKKQVVCEAHSSHCFLSNGKIISLKKDFPEVDAVLSGLEEKA